MHQSVAGKAAVCTVVLGGNTRDSFLQLATCGGRSFKLPMLTAAPVFQTDMFILPLLHVRSMQSPRQLNYVPCVSVCA